MGLINLVAGSWWHEIWTGLWLNLCNGIYYFIGALYQVFEKVASINLFSEEVFNEITGRLYVIMGVAMLFIFAYNLVLMIINPDDKKGSSNQMGKIVKETMISLVMLVLLPTIFNYIYVFQTHVLESNIIGQIVLGEVGTTQGSTSECEQDDYECKCDFSMMTELQSYNNNIKAVFGLINYDYPTDNLGTLTNACNKYRNDLTPSQRGAYSIAPTVLSAFYTPSSFDYNECEEYLVNKTSSVIDTDEEKQICVNYYFDVNYSKYTGNISAFVNDSYLKSIVSDPNNDNMEFHSLMAIVAGVLALYMFFCFAMEIGVRVAKLGFLQLISPIPVMMRIIPGQKEKIYDKWFKETMSTYIDVFIRLVIIYFSLFGISLVPSVMDTLWDSISTGDGNFFIKMLSTVFVILGLLKFAGDAPGLFKQFFGDSGRFSLKSPRKQLQDNKLAMGGVNAIRSGVYGATTGKNFKDRVGGFFSGAARGAVGGYDKAVKGLDTIRTERENGSTFGGRMLDRIRTGIGMETMGESADRTLERKFHTKERSELNESVQKNIDKIKSTVEGKLEKEDSKVTLEFVANGTTYKGLNYSNFIKLRESMQNDVENAKTVEDRLKAQQRLQEFSQNLEDAKKDAMIKAVSDVMNGSGKGLVNGQKLLNGADLEIINSAHRNINLDISSKSVAVTYDEEGNIEPGSRWDTEITDGRQLFGKLSTETEDVANLRDALTEQRGNISERSVATQSGDYLKYQANSRVVRGQGKSEKK